MRRFVFVALVAACLSSIVAGSPPPAAATTPRDPVVIVAGTSTPAIALEPLATRLRLAGYDVRIFQLPGAGFGDIRDTARSLADFTDEVRAATGAARLDLVAHSQGGLVVRQYIKYEGGASEVDSAILLGTPNYGAVTSALWEDLGLPWLAIAQMAIGSEFLTALNEGDDTIGDVRYTNIYTAYDELLIPAANGAMADGATNVLVQSHCWARFIEHFGLITDGAVADGILDALRGDQVRLNCFAL